MNTFFDEVGTRVVGSIVADLPRDNRQSKPVVIDLCSGLGGLSHAARQLGMEVVAGVDTNADALRTFSKNFTSARAIDATVGGTRFIRLCRQELQKHGATQHPLIIVSGPPCQGFSVAGSRDPSDKRNKVLLAVARAIKELKPRCALVENVEMLLAGKYLGRIKDFERHLLSGGYRMLTVVLNAKDYGVPQRRNRAFFLITPEPLDEAAVKQRLASLKQTERCVEDAFQGLADAAERGPDYDDESRYGDIPNHLAMRHSSRVKEKIAGIPVGSGPMSYRKLHPKKPANTLFSGHRAPPAHYLYPRSITVREAARLQGFPDDFRIYGSFGNQMMQVTNAVPPPLAAVVLRVLLEFAQIPLPPR